MWVAGPAAWRWGVCAVVHIKFPYVYYDDDDVCSYIVCLLIIMGKGHLTLHGN